MLTKIFKDSNTYLDQLESKYICNEEDQTTTQQANLNDKVFVSLGRFLNDEVDVQISDLSLKGIIENNDSARIMCNNNRRAFYKTFIRIGLYNNGIFGYINNIYMEYLNGNTIPYNDLVNYVMPNLKTISHEEEQTRYQLPCNYVVNIYTILQSTLIKNSNHHTSKAIIEDISQIYPCIDWNDPELVNLFAEKKELIDSIVELPMYEEVPILRKIFKNSFRHFHQRIDMNELKNLIKNIKAMYDDYYFWDYVSSRIKHINPNTKKELIDDYDAYYDGLSNYKPFYESTLLFYDRYHYFNEKMRLSEDNPFIREELWKLIKPTLNYDFYIHLNNCEESDSFKKVMDYIFDSDSYEELGEKAKALFRIQKKYSPYDEYNPREIKQEIDDFLKTNYKQELAGVLLAYPLNSNIVIVKPTQIKKRMLEIAKLNNAIDEDWQENANNVNMSSFAIDLESAIKEKNNRQIDSKSKKYVLSPNQGGNK